MPVDAQPWWKRIPAILLYPASTSGILATIFLGGLAWLGSAAGMTGSLGLGALVILGLVFTTVFAIIRESADGRTAFPEIGHYQNVRDDVVIPGVKAAVLGIALFLPAIAFLVTGEISGYRETQARSSRAGSEKGASEIADLLKAQGISLPGVTPEPSPSPAPAPEPPRAARAGHSRALAGVVIASILAALLYPLCLLVLAMSRSLLSALNPQVWMQILAAVGLPAWLGVLGGLFALGAMGEIIGLPLDYLSRSLPILPALAASIVRMWFTLAGAHLLGWFVWQHHEALGYVPDVREEMDAERVRRIKQATLAEISGAKRRGAAPGGAVMVGASAGAADARMPPASSPVPEAPSDAVAPGADEIAALSARLGSAFATGDKAAALATTPALLDVLWQTGQLDVVVSVWAAFSKADPDGSLDPPRQSRIARLLEERKMNLEAAGAWRVLALQHPASPQASKALLRSAESYTKAGHPEWARSALAILAERYPTTDEGIQARSRLRKP